MKIKKSANESLFFKQLLQSIPDDIKNKVDLSMAIASQVNAILKRKGISHRSFALMLNKKESEISKWLSGTHNFTINTLAKITTALKEPIISVPIYTKNDIKFVPYQIFSQMGNVDELHQPNNEQLNSSFPSSNIKNLTINNECFIRETPN